MSDITTCANFEIKYSLVFGDTSLQYGSLTYVTVSVNDEYNEIINDLIYLPDNKTKSYCLDSRKCYTFYIYSNILFDGCVIRDHYQLYRDGELMEIESKYQVTDSCFDLFDTCSLPPYPAFTARPSLSPSPTISHIPSITPSVSSAPSSQPILEPQYTTDGFYEITEYALISLLPVLIILSFCFKKGPIFSSATNNNNNDSHNENVEEIKRNRKQLILNSIIHKVSYNCSVLH